MERAIVILVKQNMSDIIVNSINYKYAYPDCKEGL